MGLIVKASSSVMDWFNPLNYVSEGEYWHFFHKFFSFLLSDIAIRFLAAFFLFMSFLAIIRFKKIKSGIIAYFISVIITYLGSWILHLF